MVEGGAISLPPSIVVGVRRLAFAALLASSALLLSPPDTGAQESDSTATLTGVVRSAATGEPLGNASVILLESDSRAVTDAAGRFTLRGVRAGADVLQVRLIGFADESIPLGLAAGHVTRVKLLLSETVLRMEEIEVTVHRSAGDRLAGFRQRRRSGQGVFIGPEEIEASGATRSSDLLRRVPGVRVSSPGIGRSSITVQRGQRSCEPFVYVDGLPARDYHIDNLSPNDLLGLEIYRGASETPPRFRFRGGQCATVVIWSREGRSNER